MSVPELPEAVRNAAWDDFDAASTRRESHVLFESAILTAWPHLYAAALRHAAANLYGCDSTHGEGCACAGVEYELLSMADRATGGAPS